MANIIRLYNDVEIQHRPEDRYIDATAMCRAHGKNWYDYFRLDSTQAFLTKLAERKGLPITSRDRNIPALIEARTGRYGGTWVYPNIAINLAQWLAPEFAVIVSDWVDELLATGRVELAPTVAAPTILAYTHRVLDAWRMIPSIPDGYWTIFHESADLLLVAESALTAAGLVMDRLDLLDGSIGIWWPKHRKGKAWQGDRVQYPHCFPEDDPRGVRMAWAYPMQELAPFKRWLRSEYAQEQFCDYLRRKYGATALSRALPGLHQRQLATKAKVLMLA